MRLSLQNSELRSRLAQSTAQINRFSRDAENRARGVQSAFDSIGRSLGAMGLAMGFAELSRQVFNTNVQFEKSISSLRSLTGLSGKELDYLKQQAIELGSTTTQSASQVAEAFRIIGSKQPELLKSKEALASVTKNAIVLAEAAGIEVPDAAKALTGALNQMGVGANKAEEYINILAAASQKGAADIPYLNTAIENVGGTAATLGVSFTQMVSAIEAIAPKFSDAGSAGTYLRNILLKLESSADKSLRPSVVGLNEAIINLSKKGWDATRMTEEFGLINVTAAMALVRSKDSYLDFTKSLEGTNTAYEQQKINNDNVAGAINSFKSAWEGLILSLQSSNGIIKISIDRLTGLINKMSEYADPLGTAKAEQKKDLSLKYKEDIKTKASEYVKLGMSEAVAQARATKDIIKQIEKDIFANQSQADRKKRSSSSSTLDKLYNTSKMETIISPLERGMLHGMVSNNETLAYSEAMVENLSSIKLEIEALQAPLQTATNKVDDLGNSLIKAGSGGKSIKELEKELSDLNAMFKDATSDSERSALRGKIESLKKTIKTLEDGERKAPELVKIEPPQIIPIQSKSINDLRSELKKLEDQFNSSTSDFERDALRGKIESLKKTVESLIGGSSIPNLPEINSPDLKSDKISSYDDQIKAISTLGSLFGNLTSMIQSDESAWGSWGLTTISTIAATIGQVAALFAAQAAAGIAEQSKLVFPYNIIAMSATAGALVSTIASIPKFATGGIIGGSDYYGDNVIARVNSGEMILNVGQQRNLFEAINKGDFSAGNNGSVSFEITGDKLVGVLNNYNKKKGKLR